MTGKVVSTIITTSAIFFFKIAIQQCASTPAQLFELLFFIYASFVAFTVFYYLFCTKTYVFQYESNRKNALVLAQLLALHIVVDALCLSYMSLATYCIIKLGFTATFKVHHDVQTGEWRYTSRGIPHLLLRRLACLVLIPAVILTDVLFQVVYRDAFDTPYFRGPTSKQPADEEFVFNQWLAIYLTVLVLHLLNTTLVYQYWIGTRVKSLTSEQKMGDLPKIRWFSALVVATLSPAIALVLNRTTGHQLLAIGSWVGWVSSSVYVLMLLFFYIIILESKGRKDAFIPAKRHSYYLFFTLPPMVLLYEAFFSQPTELQ